MSTQTAIASKIREKERGGSDGSEALYGIITNFPVIFSEWEGFESGEDALRG